jgi:hypothetical protein
MPRESSQRGSKQSERQTTERVRCLDPYSWVTVN